MHILKAHRAPLFTSVAVIILGLVFTSPALAAPQSVTYNGTAVTTAMPGKPFLIKFRVKNTSEDTYSGVKVTFHLPEGLTANSVGPANANVDDQDISWTDVPLEPGQSFYPTFTLTMDKGTPLKTKLSIWVEVTGTDMEATSVNFSITAVQNASIAGSLSATDVKSMFQSVYGRTPTASELQYWLARRADKPQRTALLGAMMFGKAHNVKH